MPKDTKPKDVILIDGASLNLHRAESISKGTEIVLATSIRHKIEKTQEYVKKVAQQEKPIYGVNTGFGFFANKKINKKQLKQLQLNLLRSHASGYGNPLSIAETRLAMALRLNVLVKGYTGVRFELCQALFNLIKAGIYPVIPEYGSVGASGDLAPLAHLALPLIGEGLVQYKGKTVPALQALKEAKLKPIDLIEKEGLSLINGTQIMLAVGSLALAEAYRIIYRANKIAALTFEGMQGSADALNPLIQELKGQKGQIEVAAKVLNELQGSYLLNPKLPKVRVQDAYSLRCTPQIHGPSLDAINYAIQIVETEMNAATDNPLVFFDQHLILSGGNFHGQSIAMAYDIASIAISEIANVSERRLEQLLNPHMSGLPAFLTPNEGIQSGYMAAQYLSASLVNEDKLLANPAVTDSIPGNAGIEDHVSMGMTSARKLKRIVKNASAVLAVELIAAAQAVDLRKAKPLGHGTQKTYNKLRAVVPKLTKDRIIADDIVKAVGVLDSLDV